MNDPAADPAATPDEGHLAAVPTDADDATVSTGADSDTDRADAAPDTGGPDAAPDAAPHLDLEAMAVTDPRDRAELLGELLAAEAKRDEYLDDLRRSHADFENYRRRVVRDGAVQRAAGRADVAGALLEVLDDLDRTVAAAAGSSDTDLATGVRLVATKLADALSHLGLQRIDDVEVAFDPRVHEAVQQQPGEGIDDDPRVIAILRPGYRLEDRVLRAAMVAVQG